MSVSIFRGEISFVFNRLPLKFCFFGKINITIIQNADFIRILNADTTVPKNKEIKLQKCSSFDDCKGAIFSCGWVPVILGELVPKCAHFTR